MRKIAIFVEGYTEQEFIIKLVKEIAGNRQVTFDKRQQFRGRIENVALESASNPEYYVLIVNCRTDNQVKSQILSQYESLSSNGYGIIIGLKDLHPLTIADLPEIKKYLYSRVPTKGAKVAQFIAITETEAWFLDEHSHFPRLEPRMTIEEIKKQKGIDLESRRGCEFSNPAAVLKDIYSNWGISYEKHRDHINRTVEALSAEEIYLNVRGRAQSLDEVIACIEGALFDT